MERVKRRHPSPSLGAHRRLPSGRLPTFDDGLDHYFPRDGPLGPQVRKQTFAIFEAKYALRKVHRLYTKLPLESQMINHFSECVNLSTRATFYQFPSNVRRRL